MKQTERLALGAVIGVMIAEVAGLLFRPLKKKRRGRRK